MGWIAQQYGREVHIVPDTEPGHVLSEACFCAPTSRPSGLAITVTHQDEADRIARLSGLDPDLELPDAQESLNPGSQEPSGRTVFHTIPVPEGWSIEQAWEAIQHGDLLPEPPAGWANVETRQLEGEGERMVRVLGSGELEAILRVRVAALHPHWTQEQVDDEVRRCCRHDEGAGQ